MAENNENVEDTPTSEDLIFDSNEIYIPQEWSDSLDNFTSLSPSRLNHIEQGLYGTSKSLKDFCDSQSLYIKDGWLIKSWGNGYVHMIKRDVFTSPEDMHVRNLPLPLEIVVDNLCCVNVNTNAFSEAYVNVYYTRLDANQVQYYISPAKGKEVKGYVSVIAKLA